MHLFDQLDSAALRKYALHLSRIEQESMSPYLYSPVPTPPRSHRTTKASRRSLRNKPRGAKRPEQLREEVIVQVQFDSK